MPIQLLLDWSKALVAIVCSLLLALSFIMCTAKPLAINNEMTINRTQALTIDAIERENHFILWNASLNRNPFELNAMKMKKNLSDEMFARALNATRFAKFEETKQNKNRITHNFASTPPPPSPPPHAMIPTNTNDLPNTNLATLKPSPEQDRFQMHKSLASLRIMRRKTKDNEEIEKLSTSTVSSLDEHSLNHESKSQSIGTPIQTTARTADIEQQLTATKVTTKSYFQSVFLDYSNKHIDKLNRSSVTSLQPNADSIILKFEQVDDETILSRTDRSVHIPFNRRKKLLRNDTENLERIERSANLSLSKATKRIQLLIKSRFLQLLPDGIVNGTQDENSEYTFLQRNTVDVGQIRLIGIATCLYLCMDSCGNLYTSREFTKDCIFNERLEDNYNYYTSTHHSTALRTYYLALNRLGAPRKTHLPSNKPLGKLSTYTKAFTFGVPEHRSENVIGKRFGINHVKHGIKHLCESGKELMILSERQLFVPECNVGSTSNDNMNIANSSSLSKKQPQHHTRHLHKNNNNHRSPPAALIDHTNHSNNTNDKMLNNAAPTRAAICNQEPCPKKKKSHNSGGSRHGGGGGGGGGHNKKDTKKMNQKNLKTKTSRRAQSTRAITVTTEKNIVVRSQQTQMFSDPEIEMVDDESIELFAPIPITSNAYAAIATNDEDYDNDK